MGYYIKCQEIYEYHGLVKKWSDKTHTILEDMESKLTKLSETDQMQGEAADSIKEYIRQFYLRIIPGMQALIETIESGLKVYLDEYWLNIDQSEDAVLCEDAFTEYMDEMAGQLNDYQEAQRELEAVLKSISFADIAKPEEGIITIINQALTGNMRTLASDIAELEERHTADTQEAEELAERLKEFMVESCYQPKKRNLDATVESIIVGTGAEIIDSLVIKIRENVEKMQELENDSIFKYNWRKNEYVTLEFETRVIQICNDLQIEPDDLMTVMAFESGFNPRIQNSKTRATGLIQFMPFIANELNTTVDKLMEMSGVEQLDYVYEYYKPYAGNMNNLGDVYMVTLWPAAVGKNDNYVLYTEGSIQYESNKGLDYNHDGNVTRGEAIRRLLEERETYEE